MTDEKRIYTMTRFRRLLYSLVLCRIAAQLSPECEIELMIIQNNPLYSLEYSRVQGVLASIPQQNFCTGDKASLICIIDWEDIANDLPTICTKSLGGRYLESDFTITCVDADGNKRHQDTKNTPACVGLSCEDSNLVKYLNNKYKDIELDVETSGESCELESNLEDSEGNELSPASRSVPFLWGVLLLCMAL